MKSLPSIPSHNGSKEYLLNDGNLKVYYPQGVKAVTPGQACVLYLNDECIAGGIIEEIYDSSNVKILYL